MFACLLQAVTVNMSTMTDAFLSLCIAAACADGVTVITGISNQRVKECDRISAMLLNLRACGIECSELHDGLSIVGMSIAGIQSFVSSEGGVDIQCYEDHRIAMSFGVLACVVHGITLLDQRCVEKTYPEFWDDLHSSLGFEVIAAVPKQRPLMSYDKIIMIGMRGVGKSTLARAAATALGYTYLDTDAVITASTGSR